MNYKDESDLARIKSNIFQAILASEKRREEEHKMGIVHNTSCFSQIAPWKKNLLWKTNPKEIMDEVIKEYNS